MNFTSSTNSTNLRNMLLLVASLAICLSLAGCAATSATTTPGTTPPVPTPPQVTVLQYAQLATASGDTIAHELVALCTSTPPAVNLTTCNQIKTGLLTVKAAVDQIVVEANKVPATESWPVARANIATIGATAAINAATGNTSLDTDIKSLSGFIQLILGVQ